MKSFFVIAILGLMLVSCGGYSEEEIKEAHQGILLEKLDKHNRRLSKLVYFTLEKEVSDSLDNWRSDVVRNGLSTASYIDSIEKVLQPYSGNYSQFLIGKDEYRPSDERFRVMDLKKRLQNYKDRLRDLSGSSKLDLDMQSIDDHVMEEWEIYHFYRVPNNEVLFKLALFKQEVLLETLEHARK